LGSHISIQFHFAGLSNPASKAQRFNNRRLSLIHHPIDIVTSRLLFHIPPLAKESLILYFILGGTLSRYSGATKQRFMNLTPEQEAQQSQQAWNLGWKWYLKTYLDSNGQTSSTQKHVLARVHSKSIIQSLHLAKSHW
jgi:hypothetical protein